MSPEQAIEAGRRIAAASVAGDGSISSEILRRISEEVQKGSIPELMRAEVLRGAGEFLEDIAYDIARATDAIDAARRDNNWIAPRAETRGGRVSAEALADTQHVQRVQRLMAEISRAYDDLTPASECAGTIAEIETLPTLAAHPFIARRIREIRERIGGRPS